MSSHRIDPEEDKKFNFIWNERERLEHCKKIVLATDADEAGEALAEDCSPGRQG